MAMYAQIHGYVTFHAGAQASRVFDRLSASDGRFKIFGSEPGNNFRWQYVSFAGEARYLNAPTSRPTV